MTIYRVFLINDPKNYLEIKCKKTSHDSSSLNFSDVYEYNQKTENIPLHLTFPMKNVVKLETYVK